MSCQYYCNPCPPCCTPCYPPCCTLCYFPYLVCCNPCCPIKTCLPCPPKKTPKLTDFANTGPPDTGKNKTKEVKKKETKNVKGKEEKEKKEKGPKKAGVKKPAAKGNPAVKKDMPEPEAKTTVAEKRERGDTNPPPTAPGNPSPTPAVKTADAGGGERPATTGAVPDSIKPETRKPEDRVTEGAGAGAGTGGGDGGPPRKVICKCFAKQGPCTPKPPCKCTPKPPQICTPNTPHICTPNLLHGKPPQICTRKLCGQCMSKLQGATLPSVQDRARQPGAAQIYPGTGHTMPPFAGNLRATPIVSKFTPKMQSPWTAPSTKRGRSPDSCVCQSKSRKFPFAGDGFYTYTVASEAPSSLQNARRVCEMFLHSGDGSPVDRSAQKYVPQLRNKEYSYRGYSQLPSAGDGLSTGTRKCAKCANKQLNASTLPPAYSRRQPEPSRMYQNSSYTKPSFEYARSICGTCGSIKFKPKVPMGPKKPQDCCFKGCFAIG